MNTDLIIAEADEDVEVRQCFDLDDRLFGKGLIRAQDFEFGL